MATISDISMKLKLVTMTFTNNIAVIDSSLLVVRKIKLKLQMICHQREMTERHANFD